ncbi:hypothetical protein J2X65_005422 [Ancylobacter sp. 3268]|uniref:hypothetical protein n=1 Tax=Ancylobacter sp. 3268 TaxID=2817752 RepID=UPI0028591E42|nr:hypothetical protein [Ancylobacter sp. 3268]MDR6956028.1 hypothetical protein [Ancylobacter sp. 3268]
MVAKGVGQLFKGKAPVDDRADAGHLQRRHIILLIAPPADDQPLDVSRQHRAIAGRQAAQEIAEREQQHQSNRSRPARQMPD